MKSKATRVALLMIVVLFLVTSSALTIAVIVQAVQDGHTKKASSATSTAATNKSEAKVDNTKLTGTKLVGFEPTTTPQTELKEIDTKVGDGAEVKASDTVTAAYTGALMSNGVIFDAAADHGGPISFPLNGVIKGWTQGVPGMKVGGTRRLLIPAELAYGASGNSGIPPNSDLVFDITITAIK
jgi:FKBP-type peptidyl-prolyl cis-trans isomerase FkpA